MSNPEEKKAVVTIAEGMVPEDKISNEEFYWEWIKHEENLLTNRGSFFLVAESMLFAAYASLRASTPASRGTMIAFCVLGILVTLIWWIVSSLHWITRHQLSETEESHIPRRKKLKKEAKAEAARWCRWLPTFILDRVPASGTLMSIFLPGTLLLFWLGFLICGCFLYPPGSSQSN